MTDAALDVDDAIALLERMPDAEPAAVDTSMQTDAYDPDELSLWVTMDAEVEDPADGSADADAEERADQSADADAPGVRRDDAAHAIADDAPADDDTSTAPIDITALIAREGHGTDHLDDHSAQADAERASEAALRRWREE